MRYILTLAEHLLLLLGLHADTSVSAAPFAWHRSRRAHISFWNTKSSTVIHSSLTMRNKNVIQQSNTCYSVVLYIKLPGHISFCNPIISLSYKTDYNEHEPVKKPKEPSAAWCLLSRLFLFWYGQNIPAALGWHWWHFISLQNHLVLAGSFLLLLRSWHRSQGQNLPLDYEIDAKA